MAGHGHYCGQNREVFPVRLRLGPKRYEQKRQADGSEAFEGIDQKYRIAPPFSQNAKNVCRPNVSGPDGANINAGQSACKIARRKRAEQVTYNAARKSQGPHGFFSARAYEPAGWPRPFFWSQIEMMEMSAGVIPLTRAAWPSEGGLMTDNFWRVSRRNPAIIS